MERVVGHICRNALPAGYAERPSERRAIGDALVDVLADLHAVDPARGRAGRVRPAGRLHGAPAAPLGEAVGGARGSRDLPALDALRASWSRTCRRAERRSDRARRLPAGQHVLHPTRPGADRGGARLGDVHARRSARRPRALLAFWSEDGRRRVLDGGADRPAGHRSRGLPVRAEVVERYARAHRLRRLRRRLVPGVRLLQARRRLPGIAARAAGGAMVGSGFDDAQRLVRRWSMPAATSSPPALSD